MVSNRSTFYVHSSTLIPVGLALLDPPYENVLRRIYMDVQHAIDLTREAIIESLVVVAPVLICGLLVALVLGLLQALTQIQEQSITFVPKLVAMILVLGWSLPWAISRLVQYSHDLIAGIPDTLR